MTANGRRIVRLRSERTLPAEELVGLLATMTPEEAELLYAQAREVREEHYGREVYLRGLIEFSSYCRNDCLYCGLRRSNGNAQRYRLSKQQILECCDAGYELDFRTFVLQSGEDLTYSDDDICSIVSGIRAAHPLHWRETPCQLRGLLCRRRRALPAAAGDLQPLALRQAAPRGAEHPEPQAVPA